MLKKIKYKCLLPVADKDGNTEREIESDVLDLLRNAAPYNFLPLPPLRLINSFLSTGFNDLGMSGGARWTPFQLSELDYQELATYLNSSEGKKRFLYDGIVTLGEVPDDVLTLNDLSDWKIDRALEDPKHHLNSDARVYKLADGRMVTFREYWEDEKIKKSSANSIGDNEK